MRNVSPEEVAGRWTQVPDKDKGHLYPEENPLTLSHRMLWNESPPFI